MAVFNALPRHYQDVLSEKLYSNPSLTFKELCSVLLAAEDLKKVNTSDSNQKAYLSHSSSFSAYQCDICKKKGHTSDRCFFKNAKKKQNQTNSSPKENQNNQPSKTKTQICSFCNLNGHTEQVCKKKKFI